MLLNQSDPDFDGNEQSVPFRKSLFAKLKQFYAQRLYRRIFFSVIGGTILVLFICGGISYWGYHQDRFLRKAEALMNVGDQDGAIVAFREHILHRPSDRKARLDFAELLIANQRIDAALKVLDNLLGEEVDNIADGATRELARRKLASLLLDEVRRLDDNCTAYFEGGTAAKGLPLCDTMMNYVDRYCSLRFTSGDTSSVSTFFAMHWTEKVLTNKLYLSWLANDSRPPWEILTILNSDIPYTLKQGERDSVLDHVIGSLSGMISVHAERLYDAKAYETAKSAFEYASNLLFVTTHGEYTDAIGRLIVFIALCSDGQGNHAESLKLLKELRLHLPNFSTSYVSNFIRDSEHARVVNEAIVLNKRASKAFEEKQWPVAVSRYKDLIEYLEKKGYSPCNEWLSECRYNIAMAYQNDGKYRDARVELEALRASCPHYEPNLIDERLKDIVPPGN